MSKPTRPLKLVAMGLGVVTIIGIPVLVLGGRDAAPAVAPDAGGLPNANPPPPDPNAQAAVFGDAGARAYPRVAVTADEGAEPVKPPDYECQGVRKDETADQNQFPVPQPPFSKDVYPCSRCHNKPEDHNETKRTLTLEHLNIVLVHGPREQWCYDCHNPTQRDVLRLAGGRTVTFDKSYELCGQCHGEKLRDWRQGIHGRRTGCWNGKREYLLCVHCHSPHSPHFKKLKPKPRPLKPSEIKARDHEEKR